MPGMDQALNKEETKGVKEGQAGKVMKEIFLIHMPTTATAEKTNTRILPMSEKQSM